jgi:hypothetical protein
VALTQLPAVEPLRGFCVELPRSALFSTVFSNIIRNPIENVPFPQLRPQFSAIFAPCKSRKQLSAKLNFKSQTPAKFLTNFIFYF